MRSPTFIEPFWPGPTRKPWAVRTITLLLPTWPKATGPRPWPAPKKLSPGDIGRLVTLATNCGVDNESRSCSLSFLGARSTCYEMLRFPVPTAVWRAYFSAQVNVVYECTSIPLLSLVGRNFRLNCILIKESCRNEPRSRFPKKSPFRPHFRAFYPHPANKSSLRVGRNAEGATRFLEPRKRGWPLSPPPLSPPPKCQRPSARSRYTQYMTRSTESCADQKRGTQLESRTSCVPVSTRPSPFPHANRRQLKAL